MTANDDSATLNISPELASILNEPLHYPMKDNINLGLKLGASAWVFRSDDVLLGPRYMSDSELMVPPSLECLDWLQEPLDFTCSFESMSPPSSFNVWKLPEFLFQTLDAPASHLQLVQHPPHPSFPLHATNAPLAPSPALDQVRDSWASYDMSLMLGPVSQPLNDPHHDPVVMTHSSSSIGTHRLLLTATSIDDPVPFVHTPDSPSSPETPKTKPEAKVYELHSEPIPQHNHPPASHDRHEFTSPFVASNHHLHPPNQVVQLPAGAMAAHAAASPPSWRLLPKKPSYTFCLTQYFSECRKTLSKRISCTHCEQTFANVELFTQHLDQYNLSTTYKCADRLCPFSEIGFMRKVDLRVHITHVHMHEYNSGNIEVKQRIINSNPKVFAFFTAHTYMCDQPDCRRIFYRKDTLTRHIRLVHNNPKKQAAKKWKKKKHNLFI